MRTVESVKVLLIDDDRDSFYITKGLLSQVGDAVYEVQWIDNYEAGLEMLLKGRHDACLLDYHLGARNGLELLRQAIGENCRIPIILLTGQGDREVDLQAMNAGATDFLSKNDLTTALLERSLRYAIERWRAENQRHVDQAHRLLISDQLPAILWTTDLQLRFTSMLGRGLNELNLHPDQLVGTTLFDFLQTSNLDDTAIAAHRRAIAGESVSFEAVWRGRDFQVRVDPLYQGNHHVQGTIGVALDATEHRQIERGFQAAKQIQEHLLPQAAPQLPGFDIAGICRPAEATGGDLFDYIPMSDGSLGIVVADVSNHGFGPALIMAETRRVLRTLAAIYSDLTTIMGAANQAIFEDTPSGIFVTVFFAQLDPTTRAVRYLGAGHEGHLLNTAGTLKRLESSSLPLGLIDKLEPNVPSSVQLEPGDLLVLLTDGFAEAMSPDHCLFGIDRVLGIIQAHRDRPAVEILNILYQTVCDFCHPKRPLDDITGVILKVNALS